MKMHLVLLTFFCFLCAARAESVDPRLERIVSLGGSVTETLVALGCYDQLAAVDQSSRYPEKVRELPSVGYYRMISAEGVMALKPTLVICTEDAGPPHAMKTLKAADIPVVSVTAEKSLEGAAERIRQIGRAVGKETEAAALAEPLEERAARSPDPEGFRPRVLFLYARGSGAPNVSGEGTGADRMIALAGARNAVTGYKGYRPLTAEALVTSRPEVVLLTEDGLAAMGGEEAVWSLPGMSSTPAGKEKRLVVMDDLLLLGFGPRLPKALDTLRGALEE